MINDMIDKINERPTESGLSLGLCGVFLLLCIWQELRKIEGRLRELT